MIESRTPRAVVVGEELELTLTELCSRCGVTETTLREWVVEGILEPGTAPDSDWCFSAEDVVRARTARRLQRDLGINTAAVALVMDLMDELRALRLRVDLLERQLAD